MPAAVDSHTAPLLGCVSAFHTLHLWPGHTESKGRIVCGPKSCACLRLSDLIQVPCACPACAPPPQVCDVNGVCVDAAEDEIFKLTTREGQLVVEAETVRRRTLRCAAL